MKLVKKPTAGAVPIDDGLTWKLLVVDDERVIREILAEFLQLEGYQVATCEDGQKALDELRKGNLMLPVQGQQKPVKADCSRFAPTKAVSQSQFGCT